MIAKGIIDVTPFVKETYDITKWRSAFSKMKSGTIIKAIIVPSEAKRT
jgi:Zn-dependent alcohol dehydrogenase